MSASNLLVPTETRPNGISTIRASPAAGKANRRLYGTTSFDRREAPHQENTPRESRGPVVDDGIACRTRGRRQRAGAPVWSGRDFSPLVIPVQSTH